MNTRTLASLVGACFVATFLSLPPARAETGAADVSSNGQPQSTSHSQADDATGTMLASAQAADGSAGKSDQQQDKSSDPANAEDADQTGNAEGEDGGAAPAKPAVGEPLEVNLSGADLRVDVVGDSVIVSGVGPDLEIVQALVTQLDDEIPPLAYRVITLKNKNAQDVAEVVQKVMQEMLPREPRPEESVNVNTISSNILIVTGPESRLEMVERIVARIDQVKEVLPDFESMTFRLEHVKAVEAAAKLQTLIDALRVQIGEDRANQITIEPVPASNSLLIIAPTAEREKIGQLIREIDVEAEQGFGDLKLAFFPLLNSDAGALAEVLNELLTAADGAEAVAETIRRIRMIRSGVDGELEELPPINLERQIKLIPDEESNALICATAEENISPLRELINLLDGVPLAVEQSLRVFPLKHADATTVKDFLADMFEQGKDLPRPAPGTESSDAVPASEMGKALVYNVGVSADPRTNTLIVTGRSEQLELVAQVIDSLDVPGMNIKHPIHLITLTSTDATRLSAILEDLWERRIEAMEGTSVGEAAIARERVFISVDLRSNSLIVSATEENFREISRIANTFETAPDQFIDQIRIITCRVVSAADLKTKIDELWKRRAELSSGAELPQDTPVVVADQRSNSLVIASSPEDFADIKRLVDKLESQPLAPIAEIRLLQLQNNDASQVGDMLQQLFDERLQQRLVQGQQENPSDRVAIATEPATNMILVASSRENYEEIERIVEKLDTEPNLEGVIRIFTLENAQAELVAEKIDELFQEGLYLGMVAADNQITEARQQVSVISDQRSNSIVVSASKTNLSIVEKLIEQMDTDRAPMLKADTRIFALKFADAVKLAGMLDELFDGMASGAEGAFEAPTLVPEAASNTLIVTGDRAGSPVHPGPRLHGVPLPLPPPRHSGVPDRVAGRRA